MTPSVRLGAGRMERTSQTPDGGWVPGGRWQALCPLQPPPPGQPPQVQEP